MAKITSSVSISNPLPGISFIIGQPRPASSENSTLTEETFLTRPFSPMNFLVSTAHWRSPPSSWLVEVLSKSGYLGQGISSVLHSDGLGITSIWITQDAPCLCAVPTQSAPL